MNASLKNDSPPAKIWSIDASLEKKVSLKQAAESSLSRCTASSDRELNSLLPRDTSRLKF